MSKHVASSSSSSSLGATNKRAKQPEPQRTITRSAASADNQQQQQQQQPSSSVSWKVFCDLDGVLCDFDAGFRRISGNGGGPHDYNLNHMWSMVARSDSFYEHLPWTMDGRELWTAIQHLNPDILTGVPRHWSARAEKAEWCRRELGLLSPNTTRRRINHVDMAGQQRSHQVVNYGRRKEGAVNVITCWSRNKYMESGFQTVLIDDRESLARDWEARGGVFVHHTDTKRTLQQLRDLGILSGERGFDEAPKTGEEEDEEEKPSTMDDWMNMYGERPETP